MKKLRKSTKTVILCLTAAVVLGAVILGALFVLNNYNTLLSEIKQWQKSRIPVPSDLQGKLEYYADIFCEHEDYDEYYANKVSVKLNDDKTGATIKIYYDDTQYCFKTPEFYSPYEWSVAADKEMFLKKEQPTLRRRYTQHAMQSLMYMVKNLSGLGINLEVYIYAYKETDNLGNPQYDTLFHGTWTPERLNQINWEYMTWTKIDDSALNPERSKIFAEYMD